MSAASRLNALVVDRDEEFRSLVSECLAGEGLNAEAVAEAEEALAALKRGGFQMVVQGMELPDTRDGLGLLRRIRDLDADVCVIAASGNPTIDAAVATMKARAFDYLPKPVEAGALRRVVRDAIREHGLRVDLDERLRGEVGGRVRKRRGERGLTLKQLAGRTGLSVSLISQIELGKSSASLSTLYKLSRALDVKMAYFFDSV